ncbi:MAG: O-antigen ligase family protein [Nitrospirae bacterium]|nr:O-antigen ligase family protein [Nitrospirota bacterium]
MVKSRGIAWLFNVVMLIFLGLNVLLRSMCLWEYTVFTKIICLVAVFLCGIILVYPKYLNIFVLLVGFSFSFFGSKPFSINSQTFEFIVSAFAATLFFLNLRTSPVVKNRHIIILSLCYVTVSIFSLSLLPIGHIMKDAVLFGPKDYSLQVFNALPDQYLYSVAGVNRLVLLLVMAVQLSSLPNARSIYRSLFTGIFFSAVFSAVAGLADYFDVISLSWYRVPDIWYPNNKFGAVVSFFMNRGWFAEFIVKVMPLGLLLLLNIKKIENESRWKVFLIIAFLIFGVAIVFAGARAGKLMYPIALMSSFFCACLISRTELVKTLKFSKLMKVGFCALVFVAISIYAAQKYAPLHISYSDPRFHVFKDGCDVGMENPLLGMGYDSFRWQSVLLKEIPKVKYSRDEFFGAYDTPHNSFMQLFVSGGLAGLLLWLFIACYAVYLLAADFVKNKNYFNLPIIISLIIGHIYGMFQDMQYVPMIWSFIFLELGYVMTISEDTFSPGMNKIWDGVITAGIICVLISGFMYYKKSSYDFLKTKYGIQDYILKPEDRMYAGFYGVDKWPFGNFRFTGKRAVMQFSGSGPAELDLYCMHPDTEAEPVVVSVKLDGRSIYTQTFAEKGRVTMQTVIPATTDNRHEMDFAVSRTWVPYKFRLYEDKRPFGIGVGEIRFLPGGISTR